MEELKMIKILVACKTGMTSNLLLERLEKVSKRNKYDVSVEAVAETGIENALGKFDILLVGPQVSMNKVDEAVKGNYPVYQIATGDFTTLDAERILDDAVQAYKDFQNGLSTDMSILVACTAGVTSNLVVSNMQKAANEQQLNINIKAVPETAVANEINKFDVLLVSPQISLAKMEKVVGDKIPIAAIHTAYYSTVDGEAILKQAADLYNKK